MQPVTEPTAASRLNSRPSACGFDARNAFTTAPAGFAFGAVSSCPSFYRGEEYDSDLSLYYLRARYYNPATGRFLSRDPEDGHLKDPSSLHKYLYANGDPVNGIDPQGREALLGWVKGAYRAVVQYIVFRKGFCTLLGILSSVAWSATGHTTGATSTLFNDWAAELAAFSLICFSLP